MIWCSVTQEVIEPGAVLARVGGPEDGAVALFLGTVRNVNDDRPVSGMDYQGYELMAQEQLAAIVEEAHTQTGVERIAAVHRLGQLSLGDVSVAIAVSSPHRAPAFEAARFVIEEIKKRLPVWKKEHYTDGGPAWVEGLLPTAPEST